MNDLRKTIAENITKLRTASKLTQGELAKILNYTDKSISKWERGESLPPIETLKELADFFNVSLDSLVNKTPVIYDNTLFNKTKNSHNKLIITWLAVSFVWLIAVIVFTYEAMLYKTYIWWIFVLAVPISCVVLLIFNCIWGKRQLTFIIISILIWTSLTAIYCISIQNNLWLVYLAGIPLQICTVLWSRLKSGKRE